MKNMWGSAVFRSMIGAMAFMMAVGKGAVREQDQYFDSVDCDYETG